MPTPCLEDLINQEPFVSFANWCDDSDIALPVGNTLGLLSAGRTAASLGRQAGALSSKRALPAVLGTGLTSEEHFAAALQFGAGGSLPFDDDTAAPADLQFAAERTASHAPEIRAWRQQCAAAVKELSDRLQPVSAALRTRQSATVRAVAGRMHVALIAILSWIMGWPDALLALRFITGFALTGRIERAGVFETKESPAPQRVDELLSESKQLIAELRRDRPSAEAEFLHASCVKERDAGWGGQLLSEREMDAHFGRGQWAPIPAFVAVQPGGKRRRIDNAKRFRHNEMQCPSEQLKMCSAFQPAVSARALRRAAGAAWTDGNGAWALQSGGEDLPDAYRSLPVAESDLCVNVVAITDPRSGDLRFQSCWALLFGWASSVWQFSRWSYFLEAAARRILAMLHAHYVDDGNMVDLTAARGAGQSAVNDLFALLGTPTAPKKQQPMSSTGQFLGVRHDLWQTGAADPHVVFWPRGQLVDKALALMQSAVANDSLPPGEASKLRGILGFTATALWDGAGQAAMGPLKQRQYADVPPWSLSNALRRSFDFFGAILQGQPRRLVPLCAPHGPLVVIASDARADGGGPPTGGYLLVDTATGRRAGHWCSFEPALLDLWGYTQGRLDEGGNPIAICEGAVARGSVLHQRSRHVRRVDDPPGAHARAASAREPEAREVWGTA